MTSTDGTPQPADAVDTIAAIPQTVLVADDDATSLALLAGVLRKHGYDVVTCTNGQQAWDILRQPQAPHLVILDWMMPEMDGLDVLRALRREPTDTPPYVMMLTARDDKQDIITALDAGANDYLSKPFDVGELRSRVGVGKRMVELQEALFESRKALAYHATHDSLTGLLNRRSMLEHLQKEMVRAVRYGDTVAVAMCDLDHFKRVNDTYGHPTGDDVLQGVAKLLCAQAREHDMTGRFGGEEFLMIVPLRGDADAHKVFDRICARIAATPVETRSGALTVTLSIGVAVYCQGGTVDFLLAEADAALYKAKHQGRNRVVFAADAQ